jgi:NAD(P)-dependent dehydrogenase (short-subunit alcohol dehydrogenase family)
MKLKDRVALVTGEGSGIGRAITLAFAAEGAHVIVAGRTASKLDKTLAGVKAHGTRCLAITADVADSASVSEMFVRIDREFGGLDILVNNAGIGIEDMELFNRTVAARGKEASSGEPIRTQWKMTQEMPDETWRRMIAVHLDGTFFCTREALALMSRKNRGVIINISSTAALAGQDGGPALQRGQGRHARLHPRGRAGGRFPEHTGQRAVPRVRGNRDERPVLARLQARDAIADSARSMGNRRRSRRRRRVSRVR